MAILGHADADGHLIAEQVRRNLSLIPQFEISVVVDPARTKDHRAWLHLDAFSELDSSDLVFFVDMMFAPSSFVGEASALVRFAAGRPSTRFFLIDHHPLPLRRLAQASNLRASYRPDVVDCTFGRSSDLMLLAALLEAQPSRAKKARAAHHVTLARAMHRAAAPGGPLPGKKLMALLRFDRWPDLYRLGDEDATLHELPRGRRRNGAPVSPALEHLDRLATELLSLGQSAQPTTSARNIMSYDFDGQSYSDIVGSSGATSEHAHDRPNARDLESIMLLLELAAINLTSTPDSMFSAMELLKEAKSIGGEEVPIEEGDIKIVLGKAGFLRKIDGKLQMK